MGSWKAIEMLGYHYYAEKGHRILVNLVKSNDYDFVSEYYGVFTRVNVKVAGLKNKANPNSWSISMPGGMSQCNYWKEKVNQKRCDIYLVWLPHKSEFIELSGDFFEGSKSKSKLLPLQYRGK
jgi:hypothetical protein